MNASINSYQDFQTSIKRSFPSDSKACFKSAAQGRPIKLGDKIFVRIVNGRYSANTIAEFSLSDVNDMCEIYGRIRHYTRGHQGLARLYVRNVTRGWSVQQPYMLYAQPMKIASSVTRPVTQPDGIKGRRQIPESVRLLFGDH